MTNPGGGYSRPGYAGTGTPTASAPGQTPARKPSAYDSFNLKPAQQPSSSMTHLPGGYTLNLPRISENPPSPHSPHSPHMLGTRMDGYGYADANSPTGLGRIIPESLRHGSNLVYLANLPPGVG